ncbi:hypothetical protein CEXT_135771 [Caerostris extrusa]|uniref:Uncharacterized protein n=1 Tax=Caerostris extrusa TaxID=172846 RepID=A0AAV4Q1W4_CAEEX|nr:hypothetical protein CEXT_135771 [Caerostris extrusa]
MDKHWPEIDTKDHPTGNFCVHPSPQGAPPTPSFFIFFLFHNNFVSYYFFLGKQGNLQNPKSFHNQMILLKKRKEKKKEVEKYERERRRRERKEERDGE